MMKKAQNKIASLLVPAALMAATPTLVQAQDLEAGDWLVRGRIITVAPNDDSSSVTLNGGFLTDGVDLNAIEWAAH